jgi:conjugal transfer mating pair stabilization protein TraN
MIRLFITIALLIASFGALAATCQKTNSVCVDAAPCKTISGVQVCLTDPGVNSTCWQYTDTYTCIKPNAADYCAALKQTAGCSQTSSVCAKNDTLFNTGCMEWTNTWRCSNPSLPTPTNTIRLDSSYTLTTDAINNTQCHAYTDNPGCTLASHTCVEPAATRIINGLPVYKDCWSWQDNYTCTGQMQNDCAALQAKGCTLGTSKCITTASDGQCSLTEKVYQCQSSAGTTSSVMDCGTQQYCVGGNCFDAGHTPDPDFAQTAAMMEAMRQAGNYMDAASLLIFGGQGSSCTKSLFGLVNCCKASGGGAAMSNSAVMGFALQAGGQAIKYGSSYVYDSIMSNSGQVGYVARGIESALSSTPADYLMSGTTPSFSPSFSLYGFTASFGPAAAGATTIGTYGSLTFAFDPYSLAISVAIMVIQDILSCEQEEKMLAMRKGQNLCHFNSSYCSSKIPIIKTCIETTETYCCFNSRLARIINEGGRSQTGKGWGDCSGFTTDEFAMLDFSMIDMTEFTNEIMANVRMPSATTINTDSTATMQRKLTNYYTRGRQ